MNRLLEFIQNHALLTGAAAVLGITAVVLELRHRMSAAGAVGPSDAVRLINAGALVIDVRGADAYATGHIIDSRNVTHADLAAQADSLKKYRDKPVIVVCDSGATAAASANTLKTAGFNQVVNLRGGLAAWKQENMPVVTTPAQANKTGKHKVKA